MNLIKARVEPLGLAPSLIDRLKEARWIEFAGYPRSDVAETRRDRYQRESSVTAAAECDLLVLVIDGCQPDHGPDSHLRMPGTDGSANIPSASCRRPSSSSPAWTVPSLAAGGTQHHRPARQKHPRESLVRAQLDGLRAVLPPTFRDFVAIGLGSESPFGVIEHIVPTLAPLLLRAERTALLRRLHQLASQSKVGRLVRQLGEHGRSLWGGLKARHNSHTKSR